MKNIIAKKSIFLSYIYKPIGYFLFLVGITWWFIADHFEIVIQLPVFAIVSSFISTKFFTLTQTNFTDEISLMLMLFGCFFAVFSKEKQELPETDTLRNSSIFTALLINQLVLIFSTFFLYGAAFIAVVLINLISLSIIYLVLFNIKTYKYKRKKSLDKQY